MKFAFEFAKNSYCKRNQVGCIIVTKSGLLSVGYNGTSPGRPNVCEGVDGRTLPEVRHAEQNALSKFRCSGETTEGSIMFLTLMPCLICALDIVEAGISHVYYSDEYRSRDGIDYLKQNNISVTHLPISQCN